MAAAKRKKVENNNSKIKKAPKISNTNTNNSNNNGPKPKIVGNRNTSVNFNKLAQAAVKDYQFRNGKVYDSPYKTEKDYENSFDDILEFQKQFKDVDKKSIDAVIFHDENNDGVVAAYIVWKYLTNSGKNNSGDKIKYYPIKPGNAPRDVDFRIKYILDKLSGKNVILLDLSYNEDTLKAIKNVAKSMIVIDDHPGITVYAAPTVFVGKLHSAAAYTFKFFYPKNKVPRTIQYIDDSDRKLFLPYLSFTNLFTSALGYRFIHHTQKRPDQRMFAEMDKYFELDNPNFWIFIGKYFEELSESLKNQIAQNAVETNFQGYKVGVLNFNSPALTKKVGRQIVTNFKKIGKPIDFAILWGYEYTAGPPAYNITMIDDHQQTRINLGELAKKLGDKGGHRKGGGGKPHVGHFYWPRDIMELFS